MTSVQQAARLTGDALDALQEGVVLSDADGVVVDVNAAASRILGLPRESLLGRAGRRARRRPVDVSGEPLAELRHPALPRGTHRPDQRRRAGHPPAGQPAGLAARQLLARPRTRAACRRRGARARRS